MFARQPASAALSLFANPIPALHSAYQQEQPPILGWRIDVSRPELMIAEAAIGERLLQEIAALHRNWDGYGALPISAKTAANARGVLSTLLADVPLPDITPNPNGTISMEWETDSGVAHLESGATRYSFFLKPRVGQSVYAEGFATDVVEAQIGAIIAAMLFPARPSKWAITRYEFTTGRNPAF